MLDSFEQSSGNQTATPANEPSDEQLMERIQQADEVALAILHRRHHRLLRTMAEDAGLRALFPSDSPTARDS